MDSIRLLIAESHTLTAELLSMLISRTEGIDVTGVVPDSEKMLPVLEKHEIDVCIIDSALIGSKNMKSLKIWAKDFPDVKFLILLDITEREMIEAAFRNGASGVISKLGETSEVVEAIKTLYRGEHYLCSHSMNQFFNEHKNGNQKARKKREKINYIDSH